MIIAGKITCGFFGIGELFQRIREAAKAAGAVEKEIQGSVLWTLEGLKLGDVVEVKLE